MQTTIIKDTIALDREAKEKVAHLQNEKLKIDEKIKEDEKTLLREMKEEINQMVLESKAKYDAQLYSIQSVESLEYKQVLDEMNHHFEEKQNTWVKDIFEFCVK